MDLSCAERLPTPTVVLDTNVFVAAAFKPMSDSGQLVQAVRQGKFHLVWNEPTRRETEALLRKIPPISWDAVAALFEEENRWLGNVDPTAFTSVEDPEDRKFAALASSAGATLLSLDHHLLDAGLGDRCTIQTPSQFLDRQGLRMEVDTVKSRVPLPSTCSISGTATSYW